MASRNKPKRRASIKAGKNGGEPALSVSRFAIADKNLVYVAVSDKPIAYRDGRSRIVYIGKTTRGVHRIAESAAGFADEILNMRGVKTVDLFVYTCRPRQNVSMWSKLETALLLTFKAKYGEPPRKNTQTKNMDWGDQKSYFTAARLNAIIEKYDAS